MNAFLDGLRRERAELEAVANNPELPAARQALETARDELTAWREQNLPRIEKRGYSQEDARAETGLENRRDVARERVIAIEDRQKHALNRMREIDACLNADTELQEAQLAMVENGTEECKIVERAAQLDSIIASYRDEIATLEQKQQEEREAYGEADVAARLAGKNATLPKSLAAIDSDLSSRRTALATAERARADAQSAIEASREASKKVQSRLRQARMRKVEVDFYSEALPAFLPHAARAIAVGSWIGGDPAGGSFLVRVGSELIRAAKAQLEAEMRGEAA